MNGNKNSNLTEDKGKMHTRKEILALGRSDEERFLAICNYYLEQDYERYLEVIKPLLVEMLNSASVES